MQICVQQTSLRPHSELLALLRTPALTPTPNVQQQLQSVNVVLDTLNLAEAAVSVFCIVKWLLYFVDISKNNNDRPRNTTHTDFFSTVLRSIIPILK